MESYIWREGIAEQISEEVKEYTTDLSGVELTHSTELAM